MKRRSWIVIGSLTGVVACPSLVAIAAVLVHDLRGPVFDDKAVPVLLASGAAGMTAGAFLTSRVVRVTPRRLAIFGSISGQSWGPRRWVRCSCSPK
jgi:hypothetical protein